MSIQLSKKHGVNPSIEQCFYCLGDKGVILFGQLKDDSEAPRKICINEEPCSTCESYMKKGILLISVKDDSDSKNPYRTGKMAVITESAAQRIFDQEIFDTLQKKRAGFVPDSVWKVIGL